MSHQPSSRRSFLQKAALVTAGLGVLSSTEAAANIFSSPSPFADYNAYSLQKTDLRTPLSLSKSVRVKGRILDKHTQLPLQNAKVEVWHVSPNSKKVKHRGHMFTDSMGNYNFITDRPGATLETSSRIFFRITKGDRSEDTQLLLSHTDAHVWSDHWERQNKYNNAVLPELTKGLNGVTIKFDNAI